jgi:hypothetical protein
MSSKKWNDPQLDAAQFAIDRFLIAQQTVSEQMAEIYQSTRDGCATDEDMKRLKILREQYIALSKEVEDVMRRLLARKTNPGREFRHKRPQLRKRWGRFFVCGITTTRASSGQ